MRSGERLGRFCAPIIIGILVHGLAAHADDKKADFSASTTGVAVGTVLTDSTSPQGGAAAAVTVGAGSAGLKSLAGQKFVLQWDASGGVRDGQGYNGNFAGAQGDLNLEMDARLFKIGKTSWRPYVGVGGELAASPEWSFSQTPLRNSIDNQSGVNGSAFTGSGRITVGASRLDPKQSLMIYGFAQGAYREDGTNGVINPYGWAFNPDLYLEGGGGARFDNHNVSAILEVVYGSTPWFNPNGDGVNTRLGVTAKVRVKLPKKWSVEAITEVTDTKAVPGVDGISLPATVAGTGQLQLIKSF